jgi:transcriptional regulator of met regulon
MNKNLVKKRIVRCEDVPEEILKLVRDIGIDPTKMEWFCYESYSYKPK